MDKQHSVQHVDDLKEYLSLISEGLTAVKFSAPWCGPCKKIAPLYHDLAKKHGEDIKFLEVDTDEADAIATYLNIKAIPLFLFFNKGQEVGRFSGASPEKLQGNVATLVALIPQKFVPIPVSAAVIKTADPEQGGSTGASGTVQGEEAPKPKLSDDNYENDSQSSYETGSEASENSSVEDDANNDSGQ
jgi:thioredoxin 1